MTMRGDSVAFATPGRRVLAPGTMGVAGGLALVAMLWASQAGAARVEGYGHVTLGEALEREFGKRVTAVDIAAQPVLRLMGQLNDLQLQANVVQADLLHWQPAEPFDAILEIWWENAQEFSDKLESAEFQQAFQEMEAFQRRFVDFTTSRRFFTEWEASDDK